MRMKKQRATALAVAALGGVAGCWEAGSVQVFTEDYACLSLDIYGCIDPCPMVSPPPGFSDPVLLWIGDTSDEASVPECPAEAQKRVFDGYAGFERAHECPSCRCTEPICELPQALEGSASAACDGRGSMSFDTPAGWCGACTTPAAVPPGEIGALRIPAPTVSGCQPVDGHPEEPRDLPAPWSKRARGCASIEAMCFASPVLQPPDFRVCARYLGGDVPTCPAEYPQAHRFFQTFDDTRDCTRCACDPVEDSRCAARVSAYEDRSCERVLDAVTVTLAGAKCVTGPGLRLTSLDAQWIENEPGTCAPRGGVPMGDVKPRGESFFCCQSDEVVDIR